MITTPTIINTPIFKDDRGLFYPLNIEDKWIQSNISINKKYVFRGLHHQLGETAQSKLVTVIQGSIIDFLVDLRKGTFNQTYFFKMFPGDQLYIPKGFAHGFLSLEDNTIVQYLIDNVYSPRTEMSFDWKSNETVKEIILAEIENENNIIISSKDISSIKISPDYAETIDYSTYNKL